MACILNFSMKIFLAGRGYHKLWINENFFDFYKLDSYHYIAKEEIKHINKYKLFMLDSGAFSYINGKNTNNVNWDEYIESYAEFINNHNIKLFMELDIDSVVGIKEVERLRNKLERLTNKQCIPVWHKSRGKDYWLKMIKEYDYVAIGGIVTKEIKPSEYKYFHWFIRQAHKNNCKVHGLGFTNLKGIREYKFDSVDSTSWLSGNRFGAVHKFNGKTIEEISKQPGQRVKATEVAINNFREWVKFQKYADRYL